MKLNIAAHFQAIILRKIQSGKIVSFQIVDSGAKKKPKGHQIGTLKEGPIKAEIYLQNIKDK